MSRLSLSTISSGKTRVTNCASGTTLPVLPLPAGYSIYTITARISGASYPSTRTTCTWLPREAFNTRVPIETTSSRRSLWSPGTWISGDSYNEKKKDLKWPTTHSRDLILKIIINLSWNNEFVRNSRCPTVTFRRDKEQRHSTMEHVTWFEITPLRQTLSMCCSS